MNQTLIKTAPLAEAAEGRRSVRNYQQAAVPAEDLEEILRLTSLAPSPWNGQPWRFAVVQDRALKAQLQEAAFKQPQVGSAPVVIALYTDVEEMLDTIEETAHKDYGEAGKAAQRQTFEKTFGALSVAERAQWGKGIGYIALGYLLLAARSLGYDTSPMTGFSPQAVRQSLNLPEHVEISALVALGKGAEKGRPHHRHSVARMTRYY